MNPAGVRKSGALFGQGIYFADYAIRSSTYCRSNDNELIILLCEVALGKSKVVEKIQMNHAKSVQSVFCPGKNRPDPKEDKFIEEGVTIPQGNG